MNKDTFTLSKICQTVWVNKFLVLNLVSLKNTPYPIDGNMLDLQW